MIINVRTLEENIVKGLGEFALKSAQEKLEYVKYQDFKADVWDVENCEEKFGTAVVITECGHIDLCLVMKKKYASRIGIVRVGNFQPEFNLGNVYLMNGKEKEYQKLGNIINALNKEYEKYGFFFDTKSNRELLRQAKLAYELSRKEEKARKEEEKVVEEMKVVKGVEVEPAPNPEKMEEKEMNTINKNRLNNKTTDLENQIKEHIYAVIDLATKENSGVGYMYKKTIAVKKESGYQLTSLFEDMWTGMDVYVGHSGNMIMTPNSEKSFLTDIIESVMCNRLGVDEGVIKTQEKIKRKFEYSYSKSISIVEPDETKVYVLMTRSDAEVFWSYEDAYNKMVK